jgi:hypothetical protein
MIVKNFISDVGFAAAGVIELRPQLCPALIMGTACTCAALQLLETKALLYNHSTRAGLQCSSKSSHL